MTPSIANFPPAGGRISLWLLWGRENLSCKNLFSPSASSHTQKKQLIHTQHLTVSIGYTCDGYITGHLSMAQMLDNVYYSPMTTISMRVAVVAAWVMNDDTCEKYVTRVFVAGLWLTSIAVLLFSYRLLLIMVVAGGECKGNTSFGN